MNEAADLGSSFSAVVLFWLWWVVLTVLNTLSELSKRDAAPRERQAAGDGAASAQPRPIDPACREKLGKMAPAFDEAHFLRGAERAYEIVLEAFAAGDLATLRPLLAPDVFAAFETAIAERLDAGLAMELTFAGIGEARIRDVEETEDGVAIGVDLGAEIVSVTRSADGAVVAGDPQRMIRTADLWVFVPDPASRGRSWLVSATDGAA